MPTSHRGRPAPVPAAVDRPPNRPRDEADLLLGLVAALEEPAVLTLSPVDDLHVDVGFHPVPPDDRCGAAGMFGLTAPPGATSVGVCLFGTLRPLDGDRLGEGGRVSDVSGGWPPLDDGPVRVCVTLRDDGTIRQRVEPLGGPPGRTADGDAARPGPGASVGVGDERATGGPTGLVVDALHRLLGLASPGEPPMLWELVLGWWLRDASVLLASEPDADWRDVVDLHAGLEGVDELPSARHVALATEDVVGDTSWARIHELASRGPNGLPDLAAEEARWMDPTMFGRWMVGGLPTVDDLLPRIETHADGLPRGEGRRLRRLATRLVAAQSLLRERSGLYRRSAADG